MSKSELFAWPAGAILKMVLTTVGKHRLLVTAGCAPRSLTLFDVTEPAAPVLVAREDLGHVTDIAVYAEYCYACSVERGVVALRLAPPGPPEILAEWGATLPALPCAVGVLRPELDSHPIRLAVALRALPVAGQPPEDFLVSGHASSDWEGPPLDSARPIQTEGDLGLPVLEHRVGGERAGLLQVGYRAYPKLNQLRFVGYHQPWEVATIGAHALVAVGRSGLFLYDLSRLDIHEPGLEICPGPTMRGVKSAGRYVFLTGCGDMPKGLGTNGLMVFDLTNPAQPTQVHPWRGRGSPPALRCQLYGSGLLVLGSHALSYYDLPGASLPSFAARHDLSSDVEATDVVAVDGHAFVADLSGTITVYRLFKGELLGAPPRFEVTTRLTA